MTRKEAHAILDAALAGNRIDPLTITRALCVTGDIEDETCQFSSRQGEWIRTDHGELNPAGFFDGLMQ